MHKQLKGIKSTPENENSLVNIAELQPEQQTNQAGRKPSNLDLHRIFKDQMSLFTSKHLSVRSVLG